MTRASPEARPDPPGVVRKCSRLSNYLSTERVAVGSVGRDVGVTSSSRENLSYGLYISFVSFFSSSLSKGPFASVLNDTHLRTGRNEWKLRST